MSIYKIFPSKDATIYSGFPTTNTGLDEILEISSLSDGTVSRALVQFADSDIALFQTLSSGSSFATVFKAYLANSSNLPTDFQLQIKPISQSQSWDMGTGKFYDNPITTNGVTWNSRNTGSNWLVSGSNFTTSPCSQSFSYNVPVDIEMDVTFIFNAWTGGYQNNGFIIKLEDDLEFQTSSSIDLKYFSRDTHTIYPPCLELRWDDSRYVTGSLTSVTSSNCIVSLGNNKGEYQQDSIQRFRVNCRDKYPARAFTTSSVYLNNQYLPQQSYWSIKDLDTRETVIDFDQNYTKLSCDAKGNYFDIYMNGLEPERYYSVFIKTNIDNSELVFDSGYYFKVVQ